jgi:hypothetical protein
LIGPLRRVDEPAKLRERLLAIAGGGPSHRIGLIPDHDSRRWRFDPTLSSVSITSEPHVESIDPIETFTRLERGASETSPTPLHIHILGRYLYIRYDHGLGGGRLITELYAAVGSEHPGFAPPAPLVGCRNPGLRAALHVLRRQPLTGLKSLQEVVGKRVASDSSTSGLIRSPVSIAYARGSVQLLDELKMLRDRKCPGVSITALLTSEFLSRLHAVGIVSEDRITFIVDQCRFLPPGVGTLSNFLAVASIDIVPPYRPADLSESLHRYTRSTRSLTRYGMGYARQLLSPPPPAAAAVVNSSRARIVVTGAASTPATAKVDWAESPDGQVFIRRAPVSATHQITLALNTIDTGLQMTASFFASHYDPAVIQDVLDQMVAAANSGRLVKTTT